MKVVFKTMRKSKTNKQDVVEFNPNKEITINKKVKPVDKFVPLRTINEGNIYCVGYIPEDKRMLISFVGVQKTIEGFELPQRPEPFDYVYEGVTQKLYDGFIDSPNKVKYFENNIKCKYPFFREPVFWSF